jgi:undecaprenyl diphosphate synthase
LLLVTFGFRGLFMFATHSLSPQLPPTEQLEESALTATAAATIPAHVAIIMDGNRRWAKQRHLPAVVGHQQGVQALKRTVTHSIHCGLSVLTVYAFSTENWQRPLEEVSGLMNVLAEAMVNELEALSRQGVRVVFLGDMQAFSPRLQGLMTQLASETQANTALTLQVALNYGARAQLVDVINALVYERTQHPDQKLEPVTEQAVADYLGDLPEPDLLIRTGGEQRLSNFLLWQLAYSELYFTHTLWPDFGPDALDAALDNFAQRQRRYGK